MDIERAIEILTEEIQDHLPEEKWNDYEEALEKVLAFTHPEPVKMLTCDVCGTKNKPKRERTVFVNQGVILNNPHYEDVMTCSGCGCQIRLKEVIDPIEEGPLVPGKTIDILERFYMCDKMYACGHCCDTCKYNYSDEEFTKALEEALEVLKN